MTQRISAGVAALLVAVTVSLIATAGASAALRSGAATKLCGSLTGRKWTLQHVPKSGSAYMYHVSGSFSCPQAKTWVAKLINDRVHNLLLGDDIRNGPGGYRCHVIADKQGYAFSGTCSKGPLAKLTGFSWAGS